jgi:hypothetical protein
MEKKKLDRIIHLIREQMTAGSGAPTNHTGPHVAEFSPVMDGEQTGLKVKKKKRRPTPVGRYGTRRTWMQKGES